MANVCLREVAKTYGKTLIFESVDLDILDKEFVVFVGPSGCGKSTLLRLIAGLEDITGGEMTIDGERVNELPPAKRGVSMVFQSYALYPHMTVYENMAFGLKLAKESHETIDERVTKAAEILQLSQLLTRLPKELSGGQRQRVAIGRAIVREPKVFLFDEPLSNLDAALRVQTRIEIAKLHEDMGATMVYVTHDQVEAMTLADKIVVLSACNPATGRPARVEQVGAPLELYHHPCNKFVAGFIGSPQMNFLDTEVIAVEGGRATLRLPGGRRLAPQVDASDAAPGDRLTLGVRPEHLSPHGGGDAQVTGKLYAAEEMGEAHFLHVRLETGEMIVVREEGDAHYGRGAEITVGIPAKVCHLFNAEGIAFRRQEAQTNGALQGASSG